jgi:hypothetical protein
LLKNLKASSSFDKNQEFTYALFNGELIFQLVRMRKQIVGLVGPVCLCLSVCLSVCPRTWQDTTPTGRIFVTSYKGEFLLKSLHQIHVLLQHDKKHAHHTNTCVHLCIIRSYNSDSSPSAVETEAEKTSDDINTKIEADYILCGNN